MPEKSLPTLITRGTRSTAEAAAVTAEAAAVSAEAAVALVRGAAVFLGEVFAPGAAVLARRATPAAARAAKRCAFHVRNDQEHIICFYIGNPHTN